jgi:hypothetical protein
MPDRPGRAAFGAARPLGSPRVITGLLNEILLR